MGGKVRSLKNVDPRMTVLNWLRYEEKRIGTKEGCAEGDCGACTVVLGELSGAEKTYKAVNACILFLPCLDGKELITVEDLERADGELHPVQQKMVDLHGSQCGFCTPGFIMSMFASYMSGRSNLKQSTNDLLAGNLCRCTGYGPIIAAQDSLEIANDDVITAAENKSLLSEVQPAEMLELAFQNEAGEQREFYAPLNLEQLSDLYSRFPDAYILAGGTDIGLWVTKQDRPLDTVIYLGNVRELNQIKNDEGGLTIGAGVSYSDALDALTKYHPSMGELIRRIGSTQIRNSGTIGGNIANGSPIGDTMPAFIAVDAVLTLRKGNDERTICLEDYFLEYGKQDRKEAEFVQSVFIPSLAPGQSLHIHKISKRFDQDISAVCFAMSVKLDSLNRVKDVRLALGGMAGIPQRAKATEKALLNQNWTESVVTEASKLLAQDFTPLSDMRASADYRMKVTQNLMLKSWNETQHKKRTHVLSIREAING